MSFICFFFCLAPVSRKHWFIYLAAGSLTMALCGKWIGPIRSLDRYREEKGRSNENKLLGDSNMLIRPDCCSLGGDCWGEKFWRAQPLGNKPVALKFCFYNCCQVKKTSLVDSRTSVTDVKFGPKHLGLILATCSADGTVSPEISSNYTIYVVALFVSICFE